MASRNESRNARAAGGGRATHDALEVRPGDVVTVHYTSRNREGGIFETSLNRRPLQFIAGRDAVIAGFSEAVIGMKPGENKTVEIRPESAFGNRDASLEQIVSRSSLPENLAEGDQLVVTIGDREMDVWVKSVGPESAIIDANHPLAGETLVIDLEVMTLDRPAR